MCNIFYRLQKYTRETNLAKNPISTITKIERRVTLFRENLLNKIMPKKSSINLDANMRNLVCIKIIIECYKSKNRSF